MPASVSQDLVLELDEKELQRLREENSISISHPGELHRILIFYREDGWPDEETDRPNPI